MISRRNLLKTLLGGAALVAFPKAVPVAASDAPLLFTRSGSYKVATATRGCDVQVMMWRHGSLLQWKRFHLQAGDSISAEEEHGTKAIFIARVGDCGERHEGPEHADGCRDQDGLRVGTFAG